MNFETNRLDTFTNWPPSAPVDPIRIARAGFFYTGQGTEVQCFSCGGKISDWNYGDQVIWRHRRMDPNCAFIVDSQQSGNVPLVLGPECPNNNDDNPTTWSEADEGHNETADISNNYGLTEEDEMYRSDPLRLLSFTNWDDATLSRESLVLAGFYLTGGGRLRCAWCGGELPQLTNFGSIGSPLRIHRVYFPRCEYAASLEAAQASAEILELNSQVHISPSHTPPEVFRYPPESPERSPVRETRPQSSGAAHNETLLNTGGTWRALGVVSGGARHPQHASLAARLATFVRWPTDRQQTPKALAEAGFYHTGTDDQVRCFYCDGGLGTWEAGDSPWSEHAHWFPHCGYVLLVKGQEFVDTCRSRSSVQRTFSADTGLCARRRTNPGVNFPITESQVEECMESSITLAALEAGLDAARVRRAVAKRLRSTGVPFSTSEGLIDAVLNEQLNEESWSLIPTSHRLARDILAETLRDFAPATGITPSHWEDRRDSTSHSENPTRSPSPREAEQIPTSNTQETNVSASETSNVTTEAPARLSDTDTVDLIAEEKKLSLEEENRQLKEARLCKVCMDNEVSVVFLPCGHLVSCGGCGAALRACPLCRAAVRALVRAYLA